MAIWVVQRQLIIAENALEVKLVWKMAGMMSMMMVSAILVQPMAMQIIVSILKIQISGTMTAILKVMHVTQMMIMMEL